MAEPNDFFNQPFRLLDSLEFPPGCDEAAAPSREHQPCAGQQPARKPHPAASAAAPDDSELFFSAVRKFSHSTSQKPGQGFSIAAICPLPRLERAVKKPPAQPVAKAVSPQAATMAPGKSEEDLFLKAVDGASPLTGRGRALPRKPSLGAPPALGQMSLQDFMEGRLEFAVSNTDEYFEGHVVGLDELNMNKLRQGEFSPEAHLDLHGLNSMQAFEALRHFFRAAWYKSLRCVLLVPGRGRNSPDGLGVLRAKLQIWLVQEPFKRLVLAFCTAQPHDGGPGSVYVLLRKFRKKGRIYWERMPADADLY